jgi:hypothetical protein
MDNAATGIGRLSGANNRALPGSVVGKAILLLLVCGCGSSQGPMSIPFVAEGDTKLFSVDQIVAPASFGSQKMAVPGIYVVKGSYDLTSLDPRQQIGTIRFWLSSSYEGDPGASNADRLQITKDQPKGTYELKIVEMRVTYEVQDGPMLATIRLKVK